MANYSFSVQKADVKHENNEDVKKFPYKILNDMAKKLKAAEDEIIKKRKFYEAKIANMLDVIESNCDASKNNLNEEVGKLKQRFSDLTYENNRYHLAISNCTFCASRDKPDNFDASCSNVTIRVSTPLPSLGQGPAAVSSKIPALMSITWDRSQANNVQKGKTQTFINRMAKAITKLETKYKTPEHKRKKRLYTRKQKMSPIIPKEFSTIFNVLAASEPDAVTVPDPFPYVRWKDD